MEWMGNIYAFNGCLGTTHRRRTWRAAISAGELPSSFDPAISEWGNPLSAGQGNSKLEARNSKQFSKFKFSNVQNVLNLRFL